MTKKIPDNASDEALFRAAVADVRLQPPSNQVERKPVLIAPTLRAREIEDTDSAADILSDSGEVDKVLADTVLSYCRPGIQNRLFKRLRQGKLMISEELDLHGLSIREAKQVLLDFIALAYPIESCCACIIHGKNNRSKMGQEPIMKQYVNHWLLQHPRVLAFHSAQPRDGGTGSVYVIFKR